jgi:hypothetical protein
VNEQQGMKHISPDPLANMDGVVRGEGGESVCYLCMQISLNGVNHGPIGTYFSYRSDQPGIIASSENWVEILVERVKSL